MIGKLLDGRYQVTEALGSGGFSQTYLAQDTRRPGNPICVVKQLKPLTCETKFLETARRLFRSEAETLEQLGDHDQIPRLLAYFEEEKEFYLVQEYIAGHTLSQELIYRQKWEESKVIKLLEEVLEILEFVHSQGVIHRDIKPENVIRRESDSKLVLVDFGAVKQVRTQLALGEGQSSNTVSIGTPGYMSSEQALGQPRPNSDVYGLGMIAIQALTGILPTQLQEDPKTGEILWEQLASAKRGLAYLLTRMIRYHFKDRYQSATEVLEALRRLQTPPSPQQSNPEFKYAATKNTPTPDRKVSPANSATLSQQGTVVASPARPSREPTPAPARQTSNSTSDYLPMVIGIGLALIVGGFGLRQALRQESEASDSNQNASCQVAVPGLNVRSEPTSANNNIVDTVQKGTNIALTGKQQNGWAEINSPVDGWVFKDSKYVNCSAPTQKVATTTTQKSKETPKPKETPQPEEKTQAIETPKPVEIPVKPVETTQPKTPVPTPKPVTENSDTLDTATDKYEQGDIEGAIAEADSIIPGSSTFKDAQAKIEKWRQEVLAAKAKFERVKKAYDERRWADVVIIATDSDFPEQRYWPELLKRQVEEAKQRIAEAKGNKKEPEEANQIQPPEEPEQIAEQPDSKSKEQMHYVLSKEVSENAIEKARKFIPDAFVREFPEGARIQMGVFKDPATAKSLVEELQQQGINASIYSR